jgi:hypothetical protein
MRTFSYLLGASLIALLGAVNAVRADDKVIVHEWGTFTSLQDENGQAIGGINVDDEPVPFFIYGGWGGDVVAQYSPQSFGLPPYNQFAGKAGPLPSGDPSVTVRLETPVVYIYPPKGQSPQSVPPLDVHVDFHGGFLTQFYPYAGSDSFAGQKRITGKSVSSLDWKGVRLGSTAKPVETSDHVWTTPREVGAPILEVKAPIYNGQGMHMESQAEHFLFYRGVGHLDSPLRLQDGSGGLGIWPQNRAEDVIYAQAWLTQIRPDGTCAFRALDSFGGNRVELRLAPMAKLPDQFADSDFSADHLIRLKASMRDALVKEGLYPDEASAMLRTWELSYFKSPGMRFFYTVPREWVDKVLPLKITGAPTEITRVMVGRIELIADAEKAALARLATGPCPDLAAVKKAAQDALQNTKLSKDEVDSFYRGEKPLGKLGITIPPLVQDYLSLGRFRDALIVHEQQQHPSAALAQFIKDNQLASGN